MIRFVARSLAALSMLAASHQPAIALPTMIRLGYSECSACHISPQGGGPLNVYGRGIDQAQSLRGGEYVQGADDLTRVLTFGGRTTQDLRAVMQEQARQVAGASAQTYFWPRFTYRNATEIGKGLRVSAIVSGETKNAPRPVLSYDSSSQSSSLFVSTALLHYRAGQRLEFAAGRDQLPSGVNVPDLGVWIKSRNHLGYYESPTQLKMFWNHRRVHVVPFIYGPGGNEDPGRRESGGGTLAEVVSGRQRMVLGMSILNGAARTGDRRTMGGYVRIGFGSWGVLAEHDLTERTHLVPAQPSFSQSASYGQLFWAAREWLVASLIGERLHVDRPFEEKLLAGKLELAARLASEASVSISTRLQRDEMTGRLSTSLMLQAAFKTVR